MSGIRSQPTAPEAPARRHPERTKGRALLLFLLLTTLSAAVVRLMIDRGALDYPVARSSHAVPTPKGGGVGIAAAYALGTLWLLYRYKVPFTALAPLGGGLLLAVVSYVDDIRPGPFIFKLGAQIGAALVVMMGGDLLANVVIGAQTVHLPSGLGAPLTLLLCLFITNAVNFMDGLNGLASGSILIGCTALYTVAPPSLGALCMPLIAGIAGFLPFNYPRARIFMGDVGSQLCGFVAADLTIRAASIAQASLVVPLAVLPILGDVAFTLLRRACAGDRLTQAHRSHVYQIANRAGIGAAKVAAVYWVMTVWGAVCGMAAGHYGGGVVAGVAALALSLSPAFVWLKFVVEKARRAGITRW